MAQRPNFKYLELLICLSAAAVFATSASAQPDLAVELFAPDNAEAGADISSQVSLVVHNRGTSRAAGTRADNGGYMVDLFLTRRDIPAGFALYSANYSDGVLLRGGRVSNTSDLGPGEAARYAVGGTIPSDTPRGTYRLCARVDPGREIDESDETNNLACRVIGIRAIPGRPVQLAEIAEPHTEEAAETATLASGDAAPPAVGEPVSAGEQTTRIIREDGSIEITFADGSKRRQMADGSVERISADGIVTRSAMVQVPGSGLPSLPGGLSQWGSFLAEDLLSVIRNYFPDEAQMQAYLMREEGKDFYGKIATRIGAILFLSRNER